MSCSDADFNQAIVYHPAFGDLDADVILRTDQGPRFKIHSILLRRTSSHFETVLSIPQSDEASKLREPILLHLPESNETVEVVLRLISSLPIPASLFQDIETFTSATQLASKYSMPGALSILRAAAFVSSELQAHPLKLYKLACQNDWPELVEKIGMLCLMSDPLSDRVLHELQGLSVSEYGALAKLALSRCERFDLALRDINNFAASGTRACGSCGRIINEYAWVILRYRLCDELRRCPAGNTIRENIDSWPESEDLRTAIHCAASEKIYGWDNTKKNILRLLDGLPSKFGLSQVSFKTLSPTDAEIWL